MDWIAQEDTDQFEVIPASRYHLFADEFGNFDFSRKRGATRYFILTTVTMQDCADADQLISLRRSMGWQNRDIIDAFHCTVDKQKVRDQVFEVIRNLDIKVDATILEKSKAYQRIQNEGRFYKMAWFYHAKHVLPIGIGKVDELHVIFASLGTKAGRRAHAASVEDVIQQLDGRIGEAKVSHWPCHTDPCLQIADYCSWAIQRKWESGDSRSYDLISHLVRSEYDLWSRNPKHQY